MVSTAAVIKQTHCVLQTVLLVRVDAVSDDHLAVDMLLRLCASCLQPLPYIHEPLILRQKAAASLTGHVILSKHVGLSHTYCVSVKHVQFW